MTVRGLIGAVSSLMLVLAMLGAATRGFTALTSDTARSLDVASDPVQLPAFALTDSRGEAHSLTDTHRSTILDVVYTRCVTVCSELGGRFQQLQSNIRSQGMFDRVRLLSITFDPSWDTPARLQRYGTLLRADATIWTFAAPPSATALAPLLQTLGIRVIPDGRNGFVHNAALHVVDPTGRLVAILPTDAIDEALRIALQSAPPRTVMP